MAVAVDVAGTVLVGASSVTTINYTGITVGSGANRGLVVWVNIGSANATSGWSATWDSGASNQAMHLMGGLSFGAPVASGALFALRNPIAGTKTLAVSWTGAGFPTVEALALTGVEQSSDVNAFKNFQSNSANVASSGTLSVTVGSAVGDMVLGLFSSVLSLASPAMNGTVVYSDTTSSGDDGAGNRQAGATSVTVTGNNGSGGTCNCVTLGFDVVAASAAVALPFNTYDYPKQFDVRQTPYDLSVSLNPNLFKNSYPFNQYDYPRRQLIPHAPFDLSVQTNPNLFKNPYPISNVQGLITSWGVADLPVPQQPYNSSLYTTVTVTFTLMGQVWT